MSADERDQEVEAWYWRDPSSPAESIKVGFGLFTDEKRIVDLDIRDAVFLRYQLDGAISDYERAIR